MISSVEEIAACEFKLCYHSRQPTKLMVKNSLALWGRVGT